MSLVLVIMALLLKVGGFVFLCAAALGLLRFSDPLQRMHAATKAGTVGAGLTVAGAALASADATTMAVAALTIVFLIFTVPVAGHMLGRAIYVSGAKLQGIEGNDALKGVIEQEAAPPRHPD